MNFTLFLILLFALQGICLLVGSRVSKNLCQDDYFLAGKKVTFFPLLMTFLATQIGGGTVLGASEEAYRFGWYILLYPLGTAMGFLVLAAGVGRRMAEFRVATVAQLFERVYGSSSLKKFASLLSIVSLFLIFIGQIIATKKFLLSVGFANDLMFLAFWSVVIAYTVWGGLKAVIATDVVQAAFFIAIFAGCFAFALTFSPATFADTLNAGWSGEQFDFDGSKLCGWFLMPLLFMVIGQDMAQRCFAAESGKVVTRASAVGAVCLMAVCFVPIYFGIQAKTLGIQAVPGASILMTTMSQGTTPLLAAMAGCAIIAAIISTADSLLNAISSNLTQDFTLPWVTGKNGIRASQILTAAIAGLGIVCSYSFSNIVDLFMQSYELSISCLAIPVLAAMWKKQGNPLSAQAAVLMGALGFCLFRFYPIGVPKEIASLVLSASGFFLAEAWARYQNKLATVNN